MMPDSKSLRTWQAAGIWALLGVWFYVFFRWLPDLFNSWRISHTMRAFLTVGLLLIVFYFVYVLQYWYTAPDEKPGLLRETALAVRSKFNFWVIFSIIFLFALRFFILDFIMMMGDGMAPTLFSRDMILASRLTYIFSPPGRGDILIVDVGHKRRVCRIAALPGDNLEIRDDVILVNGKPVESWMLMPQTKLVPLARVTLSNDQFGVFADNLHESKFYGEPIIYRSDILSRVFFRLKPLSKMGLIGD